MIWSIRLARWKEVWGGLSMRREGKYILGTVTEIAEVIIQESFEFDFEELTEGRLKAYDFAVADVSENQSLQEIALSSSGWYGIKQIDTGFDSYGYDLITDYYGGGSLQHGYIEAEDSRITCIKIVESMILNTFNVREFLDKDTLLIAELAEAER